jgi:hypothetical protein
MKSAYFTIHPGKKNPPPQNGCRLKSVSFLKSTGSTSSTFPIQPDFSQNQPAAITLNTGSPGTLGEGAKGDEQVGMVKQEIDENHPDTDEVARFTAPTWEGPGVLTLGGWGIRVHG